MLSLKECRKYLGPTSNLSDSDLEQLRDSLYAITSIAFENYRKKPKYQQPLPPNKKTSFEEMLKFLSEAEKEEAIERAAIMEFEGGLSRQDAEKTALNKYFETGKGN